MKLDKNLEEMLKKRVEMERLKIEDETIKNWKEKIEIIIKKTNDFKSLEVNFNKLLQSMENRLRMLKSQMNRLL